MANFTMLTYDESEGKLRTIYDDLIKSRGKLADVHRIQSLNPKTIVSHMALYNDIMFGQSSLQRYQREMIGVVVSMTNSCDYCVAHHVEALLYHWKDRAKVDRLLKDPKSKDLANGDRLLNAYAIKLTTSPAAAVKDDIEKLQEEGFSDRDVLDATLVVSYFNFVNRMVQAAGLEVDPEEITGYAY